MDWVRVLILLGTFEGFLLLSALGLKTLGKRNLNHYFFLLVGLLSGALMAKLFFSRQTYMSFPHFWYFLDLAAFVIGPLWYLTIRKSVHERASFSRTDWLLLLPSLQYVSFVIFLVIDYSPAELINADFSEWKPIRPFYLFCFAVCFVNGAFLYKSYKIIRENRGLPALFVDGQKLFLSVLVLWMIVFTTGMLYSDDNIQGIFVIYDIGFLSLALIVFGWGYLALLKPEYFYFLTQTFSNSENFVLTEIANRVVAEIEEHELYLQKDFSLSELAERVKSNTVVTSKAINRVLGISFSDLINEYRIRHFIRLAREEHTQRLTHWALAQESGFGNKVSFYKNFKKCTGHTPKEFLDSGME